MWCTNCGKECADSFKFCPSCGQPVGNHEQILQNTDNSENQSAWQEPVYYKDPAKKSNAWLIVLVIVLIALVLGSTFFLYSMIKSQGADELQKQLRRDWSRMEQSGDSYYRLELDFTEKTVDYNFDSSLDHLDTTIATYKYKVIDGETIVTTTSGGRKEKIKVEFNADKTMMTLTPALTTADDEENWFYHDD